jgi:hypothetical protein
MRLRLWVKILMRLRLLPYCIARQKFENELKLKQMLKLSCAFDSVRFILIKHELKNWYILCLFSITGTVLTMFNTIFGAGAASRYGSGSDQKMRLLAAPAPQHCLIRNRNLGESEVSLIPPHSKCLAVTVVGTPCRNMFNWVISLSS